MATPGAGVLPISNCMGRTENAAAAAAHRASWIIKPPTSQERAAFVGAAEVPLALLSALNRAW